MGNAPINRVIRRPHDGTVVLQERVRDFVQALCGLVVIGEYGFATDVARRRYNRPTKGIEQYLMQWAVRQEHTDLIASKR